MDPDTVNLDRSYVWTDNKKTWERTFSNLWSTIFFSRKKWNGDVIVHAQKKIFIQKEKCKFCLNRHHKMLKFGLEEENSGGK